MIHEHIVQFHDAQLRAKELDVYHTDGVDVVGPPGLLKLMTTAQLGGRVRRRVRAKLALRRLCTSAVGPEVDELHMYGAVAALGVHHVARLDVVVDDGRRHGLHETQRLEELHHYPPQRFGAAQGTVPLALHEGIKCLAAELQHEITESRCLPTPRARCGSHSSQGCATPRWDPLPLGCANAAGYRTLWRPLSAPRASCTPCRSPT
mmetsp:Transcript_79983/g.259107  ORF Transcript_79983/g.259107 Transcript_79983/m.259107 type:complete len:206 (-) Transcript_79983:431-1048(-)